MKLDDTINSLQQILNTVQQWNDQGFMPTIQKDTTLKQLAHIYTTLDSLNQNTTTSATANNIPATAANTPAQTQFIVEKEPTVAAKQLNADEQILFNTVISQQLFQQFIDELFWRDKTFFDNEISKFEKLNSIDEALIYIGEKYNWTPNNKIAEKFIELLECFINNK